MQLTTESSFKDYLELITGTLNIQEFILYYFIIYMLIVILEGILKQQIGGYSGFGRNRKILLSLIVIFLFGTANNLVHPIYETKDLFEYLLVGGLVVIGLFYLLKKSYDPLRNVIYKQFSNYSANKSLTKRKITNLKVDKQKVENHYVGRMRGYSIQDSSFIMDIAISLITLILFFSNANLLLKMIISLVVILFIITSFRETILYSKKGIEDHMTHSIYRAK